MLQRQKEFEDELRKREKQFNIDFVKRVDDKESEIKRREELVSDIYSNTIIKEFRK